MQGWVVQIMVLRTPPNSTIRVCEYNIHNVCQCMITDPDSLTLFASLISHPGGVCTIHTVD